MRPSSEEPTGNLSLNYSAIAGYCLGWLPYSEQALKHAFPHLTVKSATIPAYGGGSEEGFALHIGDNVEPILTVSSDGGSGYAFSVTSQNGQALCLDRYRVGETTLADYHDYYLDEAGFWRDGSKIVIMAGSDKFLTRYIFEPQDADVGDLTKANVDVWKRCVLAEARVLISARRTRPTAEIDAAGGVKLLKKEKLHKPASLPPGPSNGDPIPLLKREIYNPIKARNSYVKLADILVHNADPDTVKTNIKAIFKQDEDPDIVAQHIAEMFHDNWNSLFMFTLDWKAEITDLATQITIALGDEMAQVTLPDTKDFPEYGSVGTPSVFETYAKSLQNAGFDLWSMDSQTDSHYLFIAKKKDRKRILKLFDPTQIMAGHFGD